MHRRGRPPTEANRLSLSTRYRPRRWDAAECAAKSLGWSGLAGNPPISGSPRRTERRILGAHWERSTLASRKRRLPFISSKRLWERFCFGRLRASLRSKLGPKKAFNTFGGRSPPRVKSKSDETQFPNYHHAIADKPDQCCDQF